MITPQAYEEPKNKRYNKKMDWYSKYSPFMAAACHDN